jgi:SPP1 family predicted phage head-tail adaptor
MFTGLLNSSLTLQKATETTDSVGGHTTTWSDIGSFRGRVSPLSSAERLAQDKSTQVTTHRIYCDPMTVTTAERIKWVTPTGVTVYFEIFGISNTSEAYSHLEMDVTEIFGG